MGINLLLITFTYPPILTTGGSVYHKLLTDQLKGFNDIARLIILTEYVSDLKLISREGRTYILRFLIPKAAKNRTKQYPIGLRLLVHLSNLGILLALIPFLTLIYRTQIVHIDGSLLEIPKLVCRYNYILHGLLLLLRGSVQTRILVNVRGISKCFPKLDSFDRILCCSENIYKQCIKLGINENKCVHVPVPFALPQIRPSDKIDVSPYVPFICFAGNLVAGKGIFELIEAFVELNGYKDLNLVLVGVNGEGDRLLDQVKRSSRIYYLGPMSHSEVIWILKQAEVFVLPSKSEGLPGSCLEAIAVGTKVLLPPGIQEFYLSCPKYVIRSIQPSDIKEGIVRVIELEELPKYDFKKHNPVRIGQAVLRVYKEMVTS